MAGLYVMIPFAIGVFVIVVVANLVAGKKARAGIKAYVAGRGGRLIDARWKPFGQGLTSEKGNLMYRVRYVDRHGNEREACCKANLWTGVRFTQDRIVRPAPRWRPPTFRRWKRGTSGCAKSWSNSDVRTTVIDRSTPPASTTSNLISKGTVHRNSVSLLTASE